MNRRGTVRFILVIGVGWLIVMSLMQLLGTVWFHKAMDVGGTVTCCGNVAGPELFLTVFPFILRGVRLVGIDSQNCPMAHRLKVWEHLASNWKIDLDNGVYQEIALEQLDENIDRILAGGQTGRVLVNLER